MPAGDIQSAFLEQIKKKLSPNVSFADSLAEILNVSRDSAYRRIRSETILSLDEAKLLSEKFGVSLDALLREGSEFITFKHLIVNHTPKTFEQWLNAMKENLAQVVAFSGTKEVAFTAKDIPIFHYFNYPKLCAFKMFFWMKSLLNYPEFKNIAYDPQDIPEKYSEVGQKIYDLYKQVPSIEIWADETANVTLKQIEFYKESGFFTSSQHIIDILDEYTALIDGIREQATAGKKQDDIAYTLYKNEILIADNTVLFDLDGNLTTFVSHNITELLMTTHENFCKQTDVFIKNLQNRSVLISTTGEKERNRFFNKINVKIKEVRSRLL